ncbi:MAG TPA: hypothetical protein VMD30_01330 [Tepidisphaeraceae bacterium]|nr:hypothetical protein [Tepidisphaeraceae bacterium]
MKRITLIALAAIGLTCAAAAPSLASRLRHHHHISLSAKSHRPIVTSTSLSKTSLRNTSVSKTSRVHSYSLRRQTTLRHSHLTRLHKLGRSAKSMHVLRHHTVKTLSVRHHVRPTLRLGHSTHKVSFLTHKHKLAV